MGIPTLWKQIQEVTEHRNLAQIAFQYFEENPNGLRGLRLGIDAPAWCIHGQARQWGASPEDEVFFWRCARLLSTGILPLFVFDGPYKPAEKGAGGGGADPVVTEMIELFGFEWHEAPGEAEAELAYLQSEGHIDAIMTDDVDTLLFGGSYIVRNWSTTLTCHGGGNVGKQKHLDAAIAQALSPNSASSPGIISMPPTNAEDGSNEWVYTFKMDRIVAHSGLDRFGLILCALMSRGDYDQKGPQGTGIEMAVAMARAGFGTRLCEAALSAPHQLDHFLEGWRAELAAELATNSRKLMKRRAMAVASRIDCSWPDKRLIDLYLFPVTSRSVACPKTHGDFTWSTSPDLPGLANFAYDTFQWPRSEIGQRFRSKLWPGMLMDSFRRVALNANAPTPGLKLLGNPGPKRERKHQDTGHCLEYRVEFDPSLWALTVITTFPEGYDPNEDKARQRRDREHEIYNAQKMAMTGTPSKARGGPVIEDPCSPDRAWIPEVHLRIAAPGFIERCRAEASAKKRKSPTKRTPKKGASTSTEAGPSSEATPSRKAEKVSDRAAVDASPSLRRLASDVDWEESDFDATLTSRAARLPKAPSPSKRYIEISSDSEGEPAQSSSTAAIKKSPKKKSRAAGVIASSSSSTFTDAAPSQASTSAPSKAPRLQRPDFDSEPDLAYMSLSQLTGRAPPPPPPDFAKRTADLPKKQTKSTGSGGPGIGMKASKPLARDPAKALKAKQTASKQVIEIDSD